MSTRHRRVLGASHVNEVSCGGLRMSYDCIGIGVGPFNLSLACLTEAAGNVEAVFLERKQSFTWHQGMQLPDATIQVSHFKDLVTLADPQNRYTFVNYLWEQGRLYHFLNAKFDAILRSEFEDYLCWAFDKNSLVRPEHDVSEVDFDGDFVVTSNKGQFRSKSISVAIGQTPHIPDCVSGLSNRNVLHTSDFMTNLPDTSGKSVTIVGGGQSGAEAFLNLSQRDSSKRPAKITWVTRRSNFDPIDDSPFANEIFTPHLSDEHYDLDEVSKRVGLKQYKLASDGISAATLAQVYQVLYKHRFLDKTDLEATLIAHSTLIKAVPRGTQENKLTFRNSTNGELFDVNSDIVIFATGYKPSPLDFMSSLEKRLELSGGEPRIRKDFSVVWDGPEDRKIFILNSSRLQRGVPDPNLSLNAWRSQKILNSICGNQAKHNQHDNSFLNWKPPLATMTSEEAAVSQTLDNINV